MPLAKRWVHSGAALNTHHLLKCIALIAMTLDHVGAFLAPDNLWWRVAGRVSVPIWFFLIGQARDYKVTRDLVLWAAVMALLNPFLGLPFFQLNNLVTIICCRWMLGMIDRRQLMQRSPILLGVACILFLPETLPLMEYGTMGLLFALMGYAVQQGLMTWRCGKILAVLAFAFFMVVTQLIFQFAPLQLVVTGVATGLIVLYLSCFMHRPLALGGPGKYLQPVMVGWSRCSMQYYVTHRLLLQAAGVMRGVLTPGLRWF